MPAPASADQTICFQDALVLLCCQPEPVLVAARCRPLTTSPMLLSCALVVNRWALISVRWWFKLVYQQFTNLATLRLAASGVP